VRLLGIGFPLTVGLGCAAAALLYGGVDPWIAAVIGATVAPTDAALGTSIVQDERVPARIRRVLNRTVPERTRPFSTSQASGLITGSVSGPVASQSTGGVPGSLSSRGPEPELGWSSSKLS
jgi:hypothetical protein